MRVYITKSKLFMLILMLICILIAVLGYFILPEKFFNDAKLIATDPYNEKGFIKSYPISMMFYHITKLGKLPFPVVGILQILVYFRIIFQIGIPKNFHKLNLKNSIIYITLLMIGIFIAMPSKEFITFCFSGLIVFIGQRLRLSNLVYILVTTFLFGIFGIFFRVYFLLLPVLAIPLFLITKVRVKNRVIYATICCIVLVGVMSYVFSLVSGETFIEMSKLGLNIKRLNSEDANSMIMPIIKSPSLLGEIVNSIHGFISINLPINAIKHFTSPKILIFSIWQILFTIYFFYVFAKHISTNNNLNVPLLSITFIFTSYLAVQGVFEPDLGSAVKHKIGVFPLIYYVFYYGQFQK